MTDETEPHEHPKPEYSQQFAEPPREAYARGVQDGIDWVCAEAARRFSPESYRAAVALERARKGLAEARAELVKAHQQISQLRKEIAYSHYRDDMGR